jgi:hypothetical protein
MAVEKLSIIEGPMAGFEENGPIERADDWMRSHGIIPAYVALGALAGAAFGGPDMLRGAAKWGLVVAGASFVLHKCRGGG